MLRVNKVIMMGRLTKDPELRYTSNDKAVCNFTIAVKRKFAKEGEQQVDFVPVVAWNKLGEFCGKYFQKGRQVAVTGRLQTRNWDDNEGKKHYVTEIVAEEAFFADSKMESRKDNVGDAAEPTDGFYPLDVDDELPF